VRLVVWGLWPGDVDIGGHGGEHSPGLAMLRDYDAQGGWQLWFFSDYAPVEPLEGQPMMRSSRPAAGP
jgi:hypothetical protein